MATFGGTTQKCTACEKTVYLVDQLSTDGKIYHRACFRCHHCKGTLKLSNYSSFEGVLYCKPHFDQLFKMTGSLERSFEGAPRTARIADQGQTQKRISTLFCGTQEKCIACMKTVYPIEKVAVDGVLYHKSCFRCTHGGCTISPSNYVAHEHRLYCRHHHHQLFREKGDFSKLDGHAQAKEVNEEGCDSSKPDNHERTEENGCNLGNHNKHEQIKEKGCDASKVDNHERINEANEKSNGMSKLDNHEQIRVIENGSNLGKLDNHEQIKVNNHVQEMIKEATDVAPTSD